MTKTFKKGIDSLISGTPAKRGRPKTNLKAITKSSQIGTKENETRATFIVNETKLESIKALAYWERTSIKEILDTAIDDYLTKKKSDLTKALSAYNRKSNKA
jgi:hypothetical protein